MTPYVEPGGSWRASWIVAAAVLLVVVLELLLPGRDLPGPVWAALVVVLGIVAAGGLSARRIWTVRVDGDGLAVGRERVPLSAVDADHLRAVDAGADVGAPVLGGGWSLPKGRTGLPLRLADGRTVLVPTRDPAALRSALLAAQGTLGS
ncbi:hypothetical protein [Blastococcus deserti]|uniref:DUF3093 family protein n=1 Tax=Blastococcus deserti TaxID=2259033 RepID=A0ABW4X401_9ACTN